ncbi:nuclear transport factor 2 family protein [Kineobactrum salinum]|uniref:Nuclear transport factor 2 family protein n=1 Tax=Kineobactrum salinum TaxID=2708301 RepID=A0A6C0U039_9GAMM|nr:nuclear transport factor 2 family protein [Kineobactrum salinum]QIB65278.1 nuclear transport factor 2 family protein [Kineobactrum salinum]
MTDLTGKLEQLLAKQEIHDVIMRYARGVDRADEALLKSCYHADAIEEHGSTYSGSAHAYFDAAVPRIRKMGPMAHYVCNITIELQGDTAYVESYLITFARFARDGQDFDTFTGGRICDRFEQREGNWLIAHRKMVFDWNHDMPANQGWCLGMFDPSHPAMNFGRKDEQDLSYQRF